MSAPETLQTERLSGERVSDAHFDELRRLYADPRVMATLSATGQPDTEEETRQRLDRVTAHWEQHGFGQWVWRRKDDGQFVGRGGLSVQQVDEVTEIEIGYALLPEFWGQGYAAEIARAGVGGGFETLQLADIISFTLTTNVRSRRVMEKVGLTYERDIVRAGLPHVLYRITALQWQQINHANQR